MSFNNDKFSWEIMNYLLEMDYVYDKAYEGVYDWLNLCTNIKTVDFYTGKYDESLLYCGRAWDYVSDQTDIWKVLNVKLVQFNYAWCALESIVECQVDECLISNCGKINAACLELKEKLQISDTPEMYLSMYLDMVDKLKNMPQFEKDLERLGITAEHLFPNKNCANETGAGMLVTYKIRNKLAHGSWRFPEPVESDFDVVPDVSKIIDYAISMVLFSIVMLLIVDCVTFDDVIDDATYCLNIVGKRPTEYLKKLYQMISLNEE